MSDLDDLEAGNYHFAWKLVVLGDTGVGKTTLLKHHVQDDGDTPPPAPRCSRVCCAADAPIFERIG